MDVCEVFASALSPLPCPVSQPPADGNGRTYAVFSEVLGTYEAHASNAPHRLNHMMQFHVFSLEGGGVHRELFFVGLELLRGAGVKVRSYGPDQYEPDTGMHHIAATCEWVETIGD